MGSVHCGLNFGVANGLLINSVGITSLISVSGKFGEFSVAKKDFEGALGWSLKAEGLCKGTVCIPARVLKGLTDGVSIDLVEFARVTNQNIVVDQERKIAALGEHADTRSEAMTTLDAPDFTLPDIHGKQISFSDFNRRKRLLLAWSSW